MTGPAGLLNQMTEADARAALLGCCASRRWVEGMLRERPYADDGALYAAARRIWEGLSPEDWLEAFAAHPRIGERKERVGAREAREQAGMDSAGAAVRRDIESTNRAYEDKFGHVFLICATGKSAQHMLDAARARLANDPQTELRIAAQQQALITELRLAKLGES